MILNAAGLTVTDSGAVADADVLSVTRTVKLLDPAVPGVPEIVPPAARLKPAGSDPLATDHAYGGVPPEAPSVCEYAAPTVPAGSDDVVIPNAGGLTVSDNAFVALPPPLSVNFTVKAAAPAAEGVPLTTPVDAARLKPCGNVPSDIAQVSGETAPDAARVAEYAEPAVALGSVTVVITGLELTVISRTCVAVAPESSRTLTVNWDVPLFFGVPLIMPPLLIASPAGRAPTDTDQV